MKRIPEKLFVIMMVVVALYWQLSFLLGLPIPRGTKVSDSCDTYYKNWFGIYYISVNNTLGLILNGEWGYLGGADKETFTVIDDRWAKDSNTVWYKDTAVKSADASSFHIDESGLAKDSLNVYVYDWRTCGMRPVKCDIDVPTAEYFVHKHNGQDWTWIRDKDHVYHEEVRLDVDRATFAPLADSEWWIDKDCIYRDYYDPDTESGVVGTVDSLQTSPDRLVVGDDYLRNGRNIIHMGRVCVRDIDVTRFEEIGPGRCIVNDMLLAAGERILKDSLDVPAARFYDRGYIAADRRHVFYGRKQLDDIDAATFRQTDADTYEDRDYIYTLKDNSRKEDYPFDRRRKE